MKRKRVPIPERQRRISEGLRLAWKRRKARAMTLTITIDCDNAAFEDHPGAEVGRMLRGLAARLESAPGNLDAGEAIHLYDVNGNRVGNCVVTA